MKSFIIVKKGTTQIESRYKNPSCLYDGNENSDPHYEVPSTFDVDTVYIAFEGSDPVFFTNNILEANINVEKTNAIRRIRNRLLMESDWTRLDDVVLSDLQKREWKAYRQELRDFMSNVKVTDVVWPTPPSAF